MPGFKEFAAFGTKCFAIDFPFEKDVSMILFWPFLKPEVFSGGIRPSVAAGNPFLHNRFVVYPHYPNQFVRHFVKEVPSMGIWPKRGKH